MEIRCLSDFEEKITATRALSAKEFFMSANYGEYEFNFMTKDWAADEARAKTAFDWCVKEYDWFEEDGFYLDGNSIKMDGNYCSALGDEGNEDEMKEWLTGMAEASGAEVIFGYYISDHTESANEFYWNTGFEYKDGECSFNVIRSGEDEDYEDDEDYEENGEDDDESEGCLHVKNGVLKECTDKDVKSVVIPENVTEIGFSAFRGCSSLSSVVIPSSVKKIGTWAFDGCTSLSSVSIPSSVAEIGGRAFENCKSIAKVTLGDDFKKVPSEWFDDLNEINPNYEIVCTEGSSTYKAIKRSSKLKLHLKSLNVTKEDLELQKAKNAKIAEVQKAGVDAILPMVLEGVADSSFSLLSNTKSATVALVQVGRNTGVFKLGADSSKWLPKLQKVIEAMADSTKSGEDIFGVIKEQKMPLCEIPVKKAENLTLKAGADKTVRLFCKGWTWYSIFPEDVRSAELFGVTEIGGAAFYGCTALASVVIPASVTEIGGAAFYGCTALASVVIPASVTEIGESAFKGCTALASVVIPESVTEIDNSVFEGCTALASVVIPESVTAIGNSAFEGCKALASVVIPESVTKIGYKAFYGCEALASVVIPESVTEIGRGAFEGCESLTAVEFGGTMAQWDAVKGKDNLFNGNVPATGVKCADGEWQKPVLLVEDGVVVECLDKSAASVEIPAGVTTIGRRAFQDCKALASVEIPAGVTVIYEYAFCGCTSLASVEFGGTVAQWEAVEKWVDWHEDVPAKVVKCSDGEAEL